MDKSLQNFQRDLEKLSKAVRNKVVRQAQRAALKPLAAGIKTNAPVSTGELKKSIKVRSGKRKLGYIVTEVNISTSEENSHAGRAEFGTKDAPAKPFIRPEARSKRDEVVRDFIDRVDQGIRSA